MEILLVGIAESVNRNRHGTLDIQGFSGPSRAVWVSKLPSLVPRLAVVVYFLPEAGERGKSVSLRVAFLDPQGKEFRPPVRAVVSPSATTNRPHADQPVVIRLPEFSVTRDGAYRLRVTLGGRGAAAVDAPIDVIAITV